MYALRNRALLGCEPLTQLGDDMLNIYSTTLSYCHGYSFRHLCFVCAKFKFAALQTCSVEQLTWSVVCSACVPCHDSEICNDPRTVI